MKNYLTAGLLALFLVSCGTAEQNGTLGRQGSKNWINDAVYFTYKFDKKPAMGMVVVIVDVFNKNGERNNDYSITGSYGMPEMRAHDSGDIELQQNKNGTYLLPVNIVMPGSWEVKIKLVKDTVEVFSGTININVN